MSAILNFSLRADSDLTTLLPRDIKGVIDTLDFLCDNPYGAQNANFRKQPQIRRAVSGVYLIYYEYDAEKQEILVLTIRHGRRRPPALRDVLPQK